MIAPLRNAGIALLLKPGVPDETVDAAAVTRVAGEHELFLRSERPRGERQFCERRFSDEAGRELVYREDHVLGLRVLLFAGPDVFELRDRLAATLPNTTLDEALAAAEACEGAAGAAAEKVATLGPLCALFAYGEGEAVAQEVYTLLYRRIHDAELAVRRAALCCASYLVSPEVTEILATAAQDADLAVEIRRQLQLRQQLNATLDYAYHLERAEAERAAKRPFSALVAAQIGLALARRTGIFLHEIIALCDALRAAIPVAFQVEPASVLALSELSALLDLGRFHEAEEVITELLRLEQEGAVRIEPPVRGSLVARLAEALRGRGRHDLAAASLHEELARLQVVGGLDPDALRSCIRRLQALL